MADENTIQKFVAKIDEFKSKYARLIAPETVDAVYNSGDQELIDKYKATRARAVAFNNTLETAVGGYRAFKDTYVSLRDRASMAIGDAVDEIRSWFGRDPAPGLGAVQLPAAGVLIGMVATATFLIGGMNWIFNRIDANAISKRDNIPLAQAYEKVKGASFAGELGKMVPLLAGAAFAVYLLSR